VPHAGGDRDHRTHAGNKVVEQAMDAVMIAVGEETGGLDSLLDKIADFYEDEVAPAVKALTSIIEPIMIVVVDIIVISMYMPISKVDDQIK
jgi:type IV pilus assembly protein PilC